MHTEPQSDNAAEVMLTDAPQTAGEQLEPPAQKKKMKRLVILAVSLFVIIAGGAGAMIWHEQPGFCNAFCHSPMDSYVQGWQSKDPNTLVGAHAANDVTCLECHESNLSEQLSEGMAWISGDFSDPMEPRDLATNEFCRRCHSQEDIIQASAGVLGSSGANPHAAHQETACGDCHSMHGSSTLICNNCHVFDLPAHWQD
jgi:hypothetical protein